MLDQRVTIRTLGTGVDGLGQPVQTWTDVCTSWANVRYASGAESIKADSDTSTVRASIRIRYRSGITAAMRVVHSGITLEIKAVLPSQRQGYLDLVCEAFNADS